MLLFLSPVFYPASTVPPALLQFLCVSNPLGEIVISAQQNLGKTYRLFRHPGDRIRQFLSLSLRRYHNEVSSKPGAIQGH